MFLLLFPDHEAFKLSLNLDGRILNGRVVEVDVNGFLLGLAGPCLLILLWW